ncbi:MAG: hypothetical protein EZS28_025329 [Streblomastix strix]|uniref:Uncharacterized protein n=1 Tax=Streblomastix strix TaxID=222440 RepID=A0A5J4V9T6_9EUKA|nr:MAG: hypothetical protein EZS28_025329 [Streblomastix strix]
MRKPKKETMKKDSRRNQWKIMSKENKSDSSNNEQSEDIDENKGIKRLRLNEDDIERKMILELEKSLFGQDEITTYDKNSPSTSQQRTLSNTSSSLNDGILHYNRSATPRANISHQLPSSTKIQRSQSAALNRISTGSIQPFPQLDRTQPKPSAMLLRLPVFTTQKWKTFKYNVEETTYDLTLQNVFHVLWDTLVQRVGTEYEGQEIDAPDYLKNQLTDQLSARFQEVLKLARALSLYTRTPRKSSLDFIAKAAAGDIPGYFKPFTPSTFASDMFGLDSPFPVASFVNKNF